MAEHALTIVDVFPPKFPRFRFADNTTPHSRVQQALYRNPETGKTFTGRGAKPGWLRQALSDGRSMAAFLVTKPLPAGPNAVSMKIALKAAAAFPVEPDPAADARPGGSRGRKWDKEMLGFQPRLLPSLPALREDRRAAAWDLDAMGCNAVNGRGTVPCRGEWTGQAPATRHAGLWRPWNVIARTTELPASAGAVRRRPITAR